MKNILIIGATSAIAEACARRWAQRGDNLCLAGRDPARLQSIVDDLKTRGGQAALRQFDATRFEDHAALFADARKLLGGLDVVLIAHGTLSDQLRAEADAAYAMQEVAINGTSVVSLMGLAAQELGQQGSGSLAVISSVAGDRGRQSNYVYGSAKALVSAFASGLRQRMSKRGVHVMTIKPGFVDTPMTQHLKKGALWAKPDQVAQDIIAGIDARNAVLYTPGFWRFIMLIIKHIPEGIFVRLKL